MGRLNQLRGNFKSKKTGFVEYYADLFKKIQTRNTKLNAYLEVFEEEGLSKAKAFDSNPPKARLGGLPLGMKDIISIKDHELNASSQILKGYRAPRSATVNERLEAEQAIFVGRTNCDEFAMGSSNENTPFGPVKNPIDLSRSAGGSSGGSAAAVAAELCVGALGTDTGGSIRLPASFCGITGLKPTYGRVSRSGVIAFASSLDQVGPMADDALDCAEILQVIAGRDHRDATSMAVPVDDYVSAVQSGGLKGLKIGLPKEFFESSGMNAEIEKTMQTCIELFKKEGAEIHSISLPHTKYGIPVYYVVAPSEACSNLARYDGIRYGNRAPQFQSMKDLIIQTRSKGFGPEVKRRIMLGTFSLSSGYYDAYYSKAQFVRSKIQNEYLESFKKLDLIFAPCSPSTAFQIGEKVDDPIQMYLNDVFMVTVNLSGLPSIAFPVGKDSLKLPIGGQFIGAPFQEAKLFSALGAYERAAPYSKGELQC